MVVLATANYSPPSFTKLKRMPVTRPPETPEENARPSNPLPFTKQLQNRCATNMVAKNETKTLTTSAAVKLWTGFALKPNRTTLATTDAKPELKTVEKVPEQLLVNVPPIFPFVWSLLPACLQTNMPVLIVTFSVNITLVTLDTANVVRKEERTFNAKNKPSIKVLPVITFGTNLHTEYTQITSRTNVMTNDTTLVPTEVRFSEGFMTLLRMTRVGVGTPFDSNMPVKLPVRLGAKRLATREPLLATLPPMPGVEQMQLLSMTVTSPLTPRPASRV